MGIPKNSTGPLMFMDASNRNVQAAPYYFNQSTGHFELVPTAQITYADGYLLFIE